MTELHVPADQIDGGFEFNGWYNSDTFAPQQHHYHYNKRGWWVVDDQYRVFWQMTPRYEDSYAIVREVPYSRWLGTGPTTIVIAKRVD